jgi:hypothetical protein
MQQSSKLQIMRVVSFTHASTAVNIGPVSEPRLLMNSIVISQNYHPPLTPTTFVPTMHTSIVKAKFLKGQRLDAIDLAITLSSLDRYI